MSTAINHTRAGILLFKETVASTAPAIAQVASMLRGSVFDRMDPQPGITVTKAEKIAPLKGGATKQRMKGLRP